MALASMFGIGWAGFGKRRRKVVSGVDQIAAERKRQVESEGWSPEHDDKHTGSELAMAAACYAVGHLIVEYAGQLTDVGLEDQPRLHRLWPWHASWWKPSPKNRIRELRKAGALIAAEIDRLERLYDEWRDE